MENIITYIKNRVKENNNDLSLGAFGTTLDTHDDMHLENLSIYSLFVFEDKLYGRTNWGLIDLELAITDDDDWYTLEDVVADLTD